MQTLKAEIRTAILDAAAEEFYLHGYKRASLRAIAQSAEITAGNIYCYFSGKLALLDAVLEPTFETVRRIFCYPVINQETLEPTLLSITQDIEHAFLEDRKRAYILFHQVEGTPYENVRQEITNRLSDCIQNEILLLRKDDHPLDPTLSDIYAASMMEGILCSFDLCRSHEQLHQVLTDLLGLFFGKAALELRSFSGS